MTNLRRKIEENSADPQYILTEVGVGYRMVESDETETGRKQRGKTYEQACD